MKTNFCKSHVSLSNGTASHCRKQKCFGARAQKNTTPTNEIAESNSEKNSALIRHKSFVPVRWSVDRHQKAGGLWQCGHTSGQVRDARCAQQKRVCCNAQTELYRSDQRESNIFSGSRIPPPKRRGPRKTSRLKSRRTTTFTVFLRRTKPLNRPRSPAPTVARNETANGAPRAFAARSRSLRWPAQTAGGVHPGAGN